MGKYDTRKFLSGLKRTRIRRGRKKTISLKRY